MPRYFFNVFDGSSMLDEEGAELSGLQAAQIEALQVAQGMVRTGNEAVEAHRGWRIEVVDEIGTFQFCLEYTV